MKRIAAVLALLVIGSSIVAAQITPTQVTSSNDTGLRPYQTYAGAHENINLSNGNLSLDIPLLNLPGRAGHNLNLNVQYNSKIWTPHATYGSGSDIIYHWNYEQANLGGLGWNYNIPFLSEGDIITDGAGNPIGKTAYVVTLPNGGKTSFAVPPYATNLSMDSEDGTFSHLDLAGGRTILTLKDGSTIYFPCVTSCSATSLTDANSNQISYGNSITDTVGRQVTFAGSTDANGNRLTTIGFKDSNGAPQTIVLTVSPISLFTAGEQFTNPATCSTCTKHIWAYQPGSGGYWLLTRVDLPGGDAAGGGGHYALEYNGYGELTKITYPTGGYSKYSYTAFQHGETFWEDAAWNISSDFREVTSRRVCRNTSCAAADEDVTTYSPVIAGGNLNNDTVDVRHYVGSDANNVSELTHYVFSNAPVSYNDTKFHNPRELSRSIYNSSGTLLRTVATDYNTLEPTSGYHDYLPIRVATTLNDVSPPLVSKTETSYDSYAATVLWPYPQDYINQSAQQRTRYIDNPTQQNQFDYLPNSPGALLRTTNSTWWKPSGKFSDRPLTEEVLDGTGTRLGFTQFEYDNYTEGVTPSGATQHVGGPSSNQTAVSRWRNSDGAMLTTRKQYDDAGNVRKIADPLGHWTTMSFADNWTGGNASCAPASGAAAAYPSLVQNQLGHQTATTYNSCTGTVAAQRDPNQQTTTMSYDLLSRPATVNSPDGGVTQYSYPSLTQTTVQKKPSTGITDPNLWATTQTFYDAIGRTTQVGSKNGESGSGWDVKTTCYDTRGYATFSSYPAQVGSVPVASPCALLGDNLTVDALGRVTQVQHSSDGSTVLTNYAGRATEVQDEGRDNSGMRVTRVTQVDGLGRLASVCEKSSTNQMGSNNVPGACAQDIAQTGFLTSYQYDIHDAAGFAWQVTQPGLASRYFVNDSLGQLLKATNPESGTTQYVYNDDGTLARKISPKPNQTNPAVVLTTSYSYDAIHRLTQTSYDDGATPTVNRLYDQAAATTGQSVANPIGRLTTVNAVNGQSMDVYSYDAMGRVQSNWQCTPSLNCNTQMKQLGYGYDLLGDVTSGSNGFGVTLTYNYNIASRLTSVTSSLVDGNHPATLMSGGTYSNWGLAGASFGNGVSEVRGYTPRGFVNAISDTVNLTQPAVPGSGAVTISGSERTIGGPPATFGSGSVTLSGSEQNTQVLNQAATSGSGTVNISGSEQNTQAQSSPGSPGSGGSGSVSGSVLRGYDDNCTCYVYDSGTVSITVNGYTVTVFYHQGLSAAYIAASLATNLSGSQVNASSSNGTISMTAKTNGAGTNYAVSMSQASDRSDLFGSGSFSLGWANLTGGTDPTYYTLYDSGTVTATVNGFSKSTSYGQSSTTTTIAAGLASAFNGDGASPVTASSSGASLTLISKATGAGANYNLSASSSTSQGGYFASPSFGASPTSSTLLGGHDATYNTLYDTGTVSITVNGTLKSVAYDQNSTLSGMASALATAFNNDGAAPVNASAAGATITLTARTTGASTNYSLSSSGSTGQGGYFSHPSYSGSASGANLTGGQNAGANLNDAGTVSITVNAFKKSTPYGPGSTSSSLASALVSAFNGDGASPVSASVSGAQMTLTAKVGGSASNYTLSTFSTTVAVDVRFTNDSCSGCGGTPVGGGDRNLFVNSITVGSNTVYPNDPSVSYTAAPCNHTESNIGYLLCSGDMFASNPAAIGQAVTINAYGSPDYSVYPHMQVFVNGSLVGEWDVTGTAQNYTATVSSAGSFTGTSFPATPSGVTLAGGADSYLGATTPYSASLTFVPNGNVLTANDNVNGNWSYGYDDFNRLLSGSKTGASYTYAYDRYGNRWQQNGPLSSILTFSSGNNRMDGYSYDAAGNVLNDNAGHSFTYDAENRIVQVGTNVTYVYDGEGRRIRKTISGTSTDFFYDLASHEVAEMNSSGGWNRGEIFAAGRHIATYNWNTTLFNHADWLGTERSRTGVSGSVSETCAGLPFGDGQGCTGNETSPNHFTGKERDSESGLDDLGVRYYSSNVGRMTTVDPSYASARMDNPQSWNRYSYVLNNPLELIDPTGEAWNLSADGGATWTDHCGRTDDCIGTVAITNNDKGDNSVTVYGQESSDVTTYQANSNSVVDMNQVANNPNSQFQVASQQHPEDYLNTKAAAAVYNTGAVYHESYPDDAKLAMTGGSTANGQPAKDEHGKPLHKSHHGGANIDIRYMGENGKQLSGATAAGRGDVARNKTIIDSMRAFGFPGAITGSSAKYGSKPVSPDLTRVHLTHMHFQQH